MCKKVEPQSTKEEIDAFFEKMRLLLADAPKDIVSINLAMINPHLERSGPAIIALSGSSCSLDTLISSAMDKVPDFKDILELSLMHHRKGGRHPL